MLLGAWGEMLVAEGLLDRPEASHGVSRYPEGDTLDLLADHLAEHDGVDVEAIIGGLQIGRDQPGCLLLSALTFRCHCYPPGIF